MADRVTRDFGGTPLKVEGDAEIQYSRIPVLSASATDDGDGTGQATFQVQDAEGNDISSVHAIRAWVSGAAGSEYGAPSAINSFGVATGAVLKNVTSNALIDAVTDSNGTLVLNLDTTSDNSPWCMAELDGVVYSVQVSITGN